MKIEKDYINLLPREETSGRAMNVWYGIVILFVAAWVAVFSVQLIQLWSEQAKLAAFSLQKQALDRQLTALQKELGLTGAAGMNADKVKLIKSLLGERVLWSDVFKQFSRIIPRGMWFDSLEGSATGTAEIKIRGGAFNYDAVSQFLLAMGKSGFFEKPQLNFAQKTVLRGHDIIAFEITSGISKTGGGRQ
jgi:Tfp pilus assembly protein PilN